MRDGTFKWSDNVGNVQSTPAMMGDQIVVASSSGTVHILNKFSGSENWSYSPGYYVFNSPFTSSPVVYGDDIYIGGNDGYMYALDNEKTSGPTSPFLYYIAGIIIIIIVALIALRMIMRRRRKKPE